MPEQLHEARVWVFDLDGTLTQPVHDFEHIRAELGLASGSDILATIAARPEAEQVRLNERLDELELFYARQAQPASGAYNLIYELAQKGCHLGILTRNKREFALSSLAAIGVAEFFDEAAVLGRDEARAKPDPEGIHLLLDYWQADAEQGVMIGDFRFDMEVGRAAGLTTVHVGHHNGAEWPELTDIRVDTLDQLQQLLFGQ